MSVAHGADFLFVGRREEKAKVFEPFFKNIPILLKGQGGVGKSTMAEYMVQRAVSKNPAKAVPVIITDKVRSIDSVLEAIESTMLKTGSEKMLTVTISAKSIPKAITRLDTILRTFAADYEPVLVFDNLETFQPSPTAGFSDEYKDIYEVIEHLCREKIVQLVLTGRYSIPGLESLVKEVNLNNIGFNDYWKKCQYLELFEIHNELNKKFYLDTIFDKREAGFVDMVRFLHNNLGGNFRALEFFNKIYIEKKEKITESLKTIAAMKDTLGAAVTDVKSEMALNLVFNELLELVSDGQKRVLYLLCNFRIPVQVNALKTQPDGQALTDKDLGAALEHLGNLTLIEISTVKPDDSNTVQYYFVTPIINDLLKEHGGQKAVAVEFSWKAAGDYHYDIVKNHGGGLTEYEEAFYHYHKAGINEAGVKDKINEIGARLVNYFYESSLYATALYYCKAVYELLGLESNLHVLNHMGQILQLKGDIDGALKIFLEVKEILNCKIDKNQVNKEWEGVTLNNISQIYDAKGDYGSALKYLLESLKISKKIGDKTGEGTTLNNISLIYHARGDYESALTYLLESLKISKEIGDKAGEGATLNNIGQICCARGDYESALTYLLESLKISKKIGDRKHEGATLNNISQIYHTSGDYESALKYMLESLKIRKEIGDKQGEGTTLNNISQIYDARGDYESALKYLLESLKIRKEIGDKQGEGVTLSNIATNYHARGDYESALKYMLESLKIMKEIGDKKGEGAALNNISQIYHARGDYESALKYLLESLKIKKEIGDKAGEGVTLSNIAANYHARGNYDSALKYLLESLKISKEIGDKSGKAITLFNLAMLYDATSKKAESAQCMMEVIEINKTLKSYEVSQALKSAGIEG